MHSLHCVTETMTGLWVSPTLITSLLITSLYTDWKKNVDASFTSCILLMSPQLRVYDLVHRPSSPTIRIFNAAGYQSNLRHNHCLCLYWAGSGQDFLIGRQVKSCHENGPVYNSSRPSF